MSEESKESKLRKKLAYTSGLRKAFAEAELSYELASNGNAAEALELAQAAVGRARKLLDGKNRDETDTRNYRSALAFGRRSLAYAFMYMRMLSDAEDAIVEANRLFEELRNGPELVESLQIYGMILREHKKFRQALDSYELALETGRQIGYNKIQHVLLCDAATLHQLLGNNQQAEENLSTALNIVRAGGNKRELHYVLISSAVVYKDLGNFSAALEAMEESLELLPEGSNQRNLMTVKAHYGGLLSLNGQVKKALENYTDALELARVANSRWHEAEVLRFIAGIKGRNGLVDLAFASFSDALAIYRERRDVNGQIRCLVGMGNLKDAGEDKEEKRDLYTAAYKLLSEHGLNISLNVRSIEDLIEHAPELCDMRFLEKRLAEALDTESFRQIERNLLIHLALGTLYEKTDNLEAAELHYEQAAELSRARDLPIHHSRCSTRIGRVALRRGDAKKAIRCCRAVLPICDSGKYPQVLLDLYLVLADAYELEGDTERALQFFKAMRALYADIVSDDARRRMDVLRFAFKSRQGADELERAQKRIAGLEEQMESARNELRSKDAHIDHISSIIAGVRRMMSAMHNSEIEAGGEALRQLGDILDNSGESEAWTRFEQEAHHQDEEFARALLADYPDLTSTERRLCTLLRLNNTTRDLCRLLNVSPRTIQSYRYRIRKKLRLGPDEDLNAVILQIGAEPPV